MQILAEQGGLVIAEDGPNVLVIDRGNGPAEILAFVLLVLTVVVGGFGAVALALGGVPPAFAAMYLAVGIAFGIGLFVAVRALRRQRRAPLTTFAPVAVFDRQRRAYLNGAGQLVAPLDQVRFERRMQVTSSSSKLVAVTPGGSYVLKRGNPFGGGIGSLDEVLTAAVFGPARP
ncbi:MAG: hypothetical protein ACSLFA_19780 [Mycobacterium sp.]